MIFVPSNRHLLLENVEESAQETSAVLVPDDYKPQIEEYKAYRVITKAPDCTINAATDDIVVVENSMVKQIKFKQNVYNVVLENYILGSLDE